MLTPADVLARFDGVARAGALQDFGCSRRGLLDAVATGDIRRVRRGVYALPSADRRVVTAAAHGGALTCADALRMRGVWILPDATEVTHVWMGGSGRTHRHPSCTCAMHYSSGTAHPGLAPVAVALIHAHRCLTPEAFFAAYESARSLRLISAHDRRRIRRELPSTARWMLDLARPDAGSGLESVLRFRLHLCRLTLECQVEISGVGRVDFVIDGRLILEVDGRLNHASADRRHIDLRRDAMASARGFETLRFDYALVMHDGETVWAAITSAIGRARA